MTIFCNNSILHDLFFPLQHDTNRALEWVKNVKESHGSVELNALRQAETINACGQYFVGCIDKKKWMVTLVGIKF